MEGGKLVGGRFSAGTRTVAITMTVTVTDTACIPKTTTNTIVISIAVTIAADTVHTPLLLLLAWSRSR